MKPFKILFFFLPLAKKPQNLFKLFFTLHCPRYSFYMWTRVSKITRFHMRPLKSYFWKFCPQEEFSSFSLEFREKIIQFESMEKVNIPVIWERWGSLYQVKRCTLPTHTHHIGPEGGMLPLWDKRVCPDWGIAFLWSSPEKGLRTSSRSSAHWGWKQFLVYLLSCLFCMYCSKKDKIRVLRIWVL